MPAASRACRSSCPAAAWEEAFSAGSVIEFTTFVSGQLCGIGEILAQRGTQLLHGIARAQASLDADAEPQRLGVGELAALLQVFGKLQEARRIAGKHRRQIEQLEAQLGVVLFTRAPTLPDWPVVPDAQVLDAMSAPLCAAYLASCG